MEPINCRTEGESWEEKLQGGTPFFNVKSLISERFQQFASFTAARVTAVSADKAHTRTLGYRC